MSTLDQPYRYLVVDLPDMVDHPTLYRTEDDAIAAAQTCLELYKNDACSGGGWPEEADEDGSDFILVAKIIRTTRAKNVHTITEEDVAEDGDYHDRDVDVGDQVFDVELAPVEDVVPSEEEP